VGIRRFLDKVWTTAHEAASLTPGASSGLPQDVARKLHQTIKKVTADTESLDYNTAIAAMMEYVNVLRETGSGTREAVEPLLVMLAPYAPHLAEELWAQLGHGQSIFTASWPQFDARLAAAGDVEVVVQVNGKVRGRVTVSRGASEAEVTALALRDEAVKKFVDGKPVRKSVYVQDRLLSLVV
jgi:leucyl-tRNA synthetase